MRVNLDEMWDGTKTAKWLHLSKPRLMAKTRGRRPMIPAFRLSKRKVIFSPRIILGKLAADAGVAPEVIAASLKNFAFPGR